MIRIKKVLSWEYDDFYDEFEMGDFVNLYNFEGDIWFGEIVEIYDEYIILDDDGTKVKIYIKDIKGII